MLNDKISLSDSYQTLAAASEGIYKEKGSKFIALAFPVHSEEAVKEKLAEVRKLYFDARHHCFAYLLGAAKNLYRANDDGEPNHSAGDPILGQIRSSGLTNVLVVVVRYFGGTKLGVGGLIHAYKTAASEALKNAEVLQKYETIQLNICYGYEQMNSVMGLVKEFDLKITAQDFGTDCLVILEVRKQLAPEISSRLQKLDNLQLTQLPA